MKKTLIVFLMVLTVAVVGFGCFYLYKSFIVKDDYKPGQPVPSASKVDSIKGYSYILYDDSNIIVKRIDDTFYAYGTVDRVGSVDEWGRKEVYMDFSEKKKPVAIATVPVSVPVAVATEPVVGDVKLGIDVDDVLKNAREMSIDSLLVGFNYGLA
jgi:hypothetical protein